MGRVINGVLYFIAGFTLVTAVIFYTVAFSGCKALEGRKLAVTDNGLGVTIEFDADGVSELEVDTDKPDWPTVIYNSDQGAQDDAAE